MQPKSCIGEIQQDKSVIEEISQFKSNPGEVFKIKSKNEVNLSNKVEKSLSKCVMKVEKNEGFKNAEEKQVNKRKYAQEKSFKTKSEEDNCIEKSQKIHFKSGKCQGCGSKLNITDIHQRLDKVKLFEHVHASGLPNYQCCRIPVCQASMNLPLWRDRLKGYKDKAVCDLLQFGFPLDFDRKKALSSSAGRNHKGARDFPEFIRKYFQKECDAKRIVGPFPENPLSVELAVSPMNTVPKDSADERRVIVDLSWPAGASVNDGISKDVYLGEAIDLHYASVEQVCDMVNAIGPGATIYKRDLRHAYRQVAVDPRDYRYLGYHWDDCFYFDSVLAMGQRNAAMACARTTDAVMYMHHQDGYKGTNYLDDLIGVSLPDEGWEAYESLGQLLYHLGLLENLDKACPPATVQLVLGVLINTVEGTVSVPEDRMVEIMDLVSMWQGKSRTSKTELQSLIGKLQYVTKCVLQSRVFMNRLLETLRSMKNKKMISLSESFQKDLKWWKMFMDRYNGVSFIPSSFWTEPDVSFATDSCMVGCGGICSKEYFHTPFLSDIVEQELPIHCLEMLAVLLAVRMWGCHLQGLKIQIYCDNQPAVQVINSGRTKDPFMASCIRELWLEVSKYGFQLRAVHLPGEDNRVPDWLSRWDCGQKYRDLFYNFIGGELDSYAEVLIHPELFAFSGIL